MHFQQRGFTLIEVLIVVVIVSILASIAIPSYQSSVTKTRRAEGKALLLEAAQEQEKRFTRNNAFSTSINDFTIVSDNNFYTLAFSVSTASTYTFTATPVAPHSDPVCNVLSLTHTGIRGETGTGTVADCW